MLQTLVVVGAGWLAFLLCFWAFALRARRDREKGRQSGCGGHTSAGGCRCNTPSAIGILGTPSGVPDNLPLYPEAPDQNSASQPR